MNGLSQLHRQPKCLMLWNVSWLMSLKVKRPWLWHWGISFREECSLICAVFPPKIKWYSFEQERTRGKSHKSHDEWGFEGNLVSNWHQEKQLKGYIASDEYSLQSMEGIPYYWSSANGKWLVQWQKDWWRKRNHFIQIQVLHSDFFFWLPVKLYSPSCHTKLNVSGKGFLQHGQ